MGLSFFKPNTNINFIGVRHIAYMVSVILILLGLGALLLRGGPRYGIDFAGGIIVQTKIQADHEVGFEAVQDALEGVKLPGLVVQSILDETDEYLIRTTSSGLETEGVKQAISTALEKNLPGAQVEIRRTEMVGSKVSSDLRSKALEAMFYAVLLITIYISGRFEHRWMAAAIMAAALFGGISVLKLVGVPMGWLIVGALIIALALCWFMKLNYAFGAVVALVHDVLITVGVLTILNKEFDLTIIAALLTIIGYSLNDTIIVFDRIREHLNGNLSESLGKTINLSINQTLSRTILTSGTTLFVVLALFLLGGGVIHDFALALLIGICVGTYSSIFVASPILLGFSPSAGQPAAARKSA